MGWFTHRSSLWQVGRSLASMTLGADGDMYWLGLRVRTNGTDGVLRWWWEGPSSTNGHIMIEGVEVGGGWGWRGWVGHIMIEGVEVGGGWGICVCGTS